MAADAVTAIRESVAYASRDDVAYVRITGAGALDAVDRVCAADLRVRDGQLLQTLLLNDDATCFADVYVGCDDDAYFLLAEGPAPAQLVEYLRNHTSAIAGVQIDNLSDEVALLTLDGPFAWELLGRTIGQEAIGLPYLTFFKLDELTCYRAGKTGEYGYGILVKRSDLDALFQRVVSAGAAFDAVEADVNALDQCALENWFFRIRHEGRAGLTPVELQLQWRVSYRKQYVGSEALLRHRRNGVGTRLACVIAPTEIAADAHMTLGDTRVGRVVSAGRSATLDAWIALALIDVAYSHPGVDVGIVGGSGAARAARLVSPPVLNNRSLFVSPQLHSYSTRHEQTFPPLRKP